MFLGDCLDAQGYMYVHADIISRCTFKNCATRFLYRKCIFWFFSSIHFSVVLDLIDFIFIENENIVYSECLVFRNCVE